MKKDSYLRLYLTHFPRYQIDFEAQTTKGDIKFHDFIGDKWTVLFSHPADFSKYLRSKIGDQISKMKLTNKSKQLQSAQRNLVSLLLLKMNSMPVMSILLVFLPTVLPNTKSGSLISTISTMFNSTSPSLLMLIVRSLPFTICWIIK
jgi:hypothetical protein